MRMPSGWWGWVLAVPVAVAGSGCTSVRMVQKEGCWVRQTERWILGTKEEMGPCQRPEQAWSQDPVIRAVQECVAQADYRWQARALEAWSQKEPMPDREGTDDGVLEGCLSGPLRDALGKNEALQAQLEHALEDRSALHQQTQEDRLFLQASHERISTALGEAALKPPGSATATAHSTSEGVARVLGELSASSEQRENTTNERPQREGREGEDRKAPLELMRNDAPDAVTQPPAIPVDVARPPEPEREVRAERSGQTEIENKDLWDRLESREGEAVRTSKASEAVAAPAGTREVAADVPVPASTAVRAEAAATPGPAREAATGGSGGSGGSGESVGAEPRGKTVDRTDGKAGAQVPAGPSAQAPGGKAGAPKNAAGPSVQTPEGASMAESDREGAAPADAVDPETGCPITP